MMTLDLTLRRQLERTILTARKTAETAAHKALSRLGLDQNEPPSSLVAEERAFRRKLAAQKSQLEDYQQLVEQCAYEHWHRMLFAKFLATNHLLVHHSAGVSVTLEDCEDLELQAELGASDAYDLAARYAAQMLPAVFRPDNELLKVRLAPEDRIALENLVKDLPEAVFTANDSLGWTYQFWQKEQKDKVNQAENAVEGGDISAVTQLFTEHYMVRFLLENTIGAWWIKQHPATTLQNNWHYYKSDIPHDHSTFPKTIEEITFLDPCCGSGHFLVEAFLLFHSMYREMGMSDAEAGDAAIKNNVQGLELDARCTQIAAFNLALTAWKHGGYRELPEIQIACTGLPLLGTKERWQKLAQADPILTSGMSILYDTFSKASDLGSLISPTNLFEVKESDRTRQFTLDNIPNTEKQKLEDSRSQIQWEALSRLLSKALEKETTQEDYFAGIRAQGISKAAEMLSSRYWFTVTNPPFLAVSKAGEELREYCNQNHPEAKKDLATCFIDRLRTFAQPGAEYAVACPQNWLFLGSDKKFRQKLLKEQTWLAVVRFGEGAFESSAAAGAFTANIIFSHRTPTFDDSFFGLDASAPKTAADKAALLRGASVLAEQASEPEEVDA
jgi:hypothetical protein